MNQIILLRHRRERRAPIQKLPGPQPRNQQGRLGAAELDRQGPLEDRQGALRAERERVVRAGAGAGPLPHLRAWQEFPNEDGGVFERGCLQAACLLLPEARQVLHREFFLFLEFKMFHNDYK